MSSREDGRTFEDLRSLDIVYERLDRVDGSARFGFGDTQALASISGPIEVRLAAEQPSKATFEVSVRPLSSIPGTESRSFAVALRGLLSPSLILTRNPRSLIQLVVQSLTLSPESFSPSLIAACINASSLALLNAGSITMTGVVCAAAVSRISPESAGDTPILVLDPSETESFGATGAISGNPRARLVWTNWHSKGGAFDEKELARAQALGAAGAEQVLKVIKQSVPQMDGIHSLPQSSQPIPGAPEALVKHDGGVDPADEEASDDAKMEI
ncbi:ribosomal protein S5 domain 2-type protein [Gloeopeniophorella convolvens]|nr:ribosomal protein S5 domain 2-type protein [Gloeopeniophorella convolvens]